MSDTDPVVVLVSGAWHRPGRLGTLCTKDLMRATSGPRPGVELDADGLGVAAAALGGAIGILGLRSSIAHRLEVPPIEGAPVWPAESA